MNKGPILSHVLRHPPRPCPVKGFPMALQDLSLDGVEHFSLVISAVDFSATRLTDHQRMAIAQWLDTVMMPHLNQYARVSISKIEESLTAIDGWNTLE